MGFQMWIRGGGLKVKYTITQYDKDLLLQNNMQYKYRLLVIDNNKTVIDELSVLQMVGSYSINSESDIRRTTSFSMCLDSLYEDYFVEKKLYEWIGYSFELQIGIYSIRDDDYIWYNCGYYLITEGNTLYNSTENSITTALSDWYSRLNGTRTGQIGGAPTISIPNEDSEGNPITIKQTVEGILKGITSIADYIVDDIGQFYGMPQNNVDYKQYREDNPLWNQLPYDLEYEAGSTVGDILSEINGLYPNCQMYFDIYGNFCFNMIPSCEYDAVALDDSYIQEILLSDNTESVAYDIESIKNVTEVFGCNYDIDRYSESCTSSNNTYTISINDYTSYRSGDIIAFIPDTDNAQNMLIKINSLDSLPLYYEYTTDYVDAKLLESGKTYVFQIKKINSKYVAYYFGQYQPHALCVLTNNENDNKYTKAYFAQKYNCDEHNIVFRVENESPFTVQKLGEILDVKSGDEFENILSDSAAMEHAVYYNKKASSVHDTVTITTKMVPFLDVNVKVEYKKQQEEKSNYYIIKSIVNDTESLTSHITMYRFYPLYYI